MTNSTALVTGASSGIGREIARQLAAAGITVYVGSRTIERGQRAVDEIAGNARLIVIDVTDAASVADAAVQVADLDVLVNNAGVMIDGRTATEADVDSSPVAPDRWGGAPARIRSSPTRPKLQPAPCGWHYCPMTGLPADSSLGTARSRRGEAPRHASGRRPPHDARGPGMSRFVSGAFGLRRLAEPAWSAWRRMPAAVRGRVPLR